MVKKPSLWSTFALPEFAEATPPLAATNSAADVLWSNGVSPSSSGSFSCTKCNNNKCSWKLRGTSAMWKLDENNTLLCIILLYVLILPRVFSFVHCFQNMLVKFQMKRSAASHMTTFFPWLWVSMGFLWFLGHQMLKCSLWVLEHFRTCCLHVFDTASLSICWSMVMRLQQLMQAQQQQQQPPPLQQQQLQAQLLMQPQMQPNMLGAMVQNLLKNEVYCYYWEHHSFRLKDAFQSSMGSQVFLKKRTFFGQNMLVGPQDSGCNATYRGQLGKHQHLECMEGADAQRGSDLWCFINLNDISDIS